MTKMKAGQALAKVLESWDVDHLYGITADSINNTVDGLYQERENLKYIQVRHEEVGALAAAADAKLTGKIGVSFGSAGPGATHLFNGLYDAKMDHAPVLAIVGQSSTEVMNTNFFQEMNQDPMFTDVAVFNKQVVSAQQIPYVVDAAIRAAYANKGPAVVIIPDNLSGQEIDYSPLKTDKVYEKAMISAISTDSIDRTIAMIKEAKHPVLWIGKGVAGARDEVVQVSADFQMPVVTAIPGTGIMPTDNPSFMGSMGRLGTKPAFEVAQAADLVLFVGTNFPFARFWPSNVKVIQVNNNAEDLGKQHDADLAILADAKIFLDDLLSRNVKLTASDWLKAAQEDKANWDQWLDGLANDDSKGLRAESVIKAIKENSTDSSVFGLDVGNNTEWAMRQLPLNRDQKFTLSGWFATMGYGLPAGLAAKLSYPDRQVFSISGDGGYAMVMQDLLTEVKYNLPVINVVLENQSFGFIQHEKLVANQAPYGIDLIGANWAHIADDMGAIGFTATDLPSLQAAFKKIKELEASGNTKPIVLDAKIRNVDPVDTGFMPLDPDQFDEKTIQAFRDQYELGDQPALSTILKQRSK
ncbi:pyruvate oxidase [Pediococcus claussenii]|uniref:Pyruvate oxidase n=1 Tax=Pediococcus claussenii (strain ATCC BAA-344 / DSM 14800 / JCM 18046 / KCTC 3811 / LMG 21948 / P06) TaxID=701521 RepID=G8PAU3_PEDCP|nr:pyruvate oxidase [Pediococcus claussenii]AEV95811.1 pyruvate oxidase [Pediococcus claussenii ATCC BAA-344]ANZ69309.1 pyruvate oxidase [Pediococcus claussenii]ANZ71129.1 pyruvate oxidase [Pediococcus claussenii]KRN20418.1 spxB protein [Pediococcus claussenii]